MEQIINMRSAVLLHISERFMDTYQGSRLRPLELLERARDSITRAYDMGANVDMQLNRLIDLYRTS